MSDIQGFTWKITMKISAGMNEVSKILVAEDEEDLCEIIEFNLRAEGFHVDIVHSAEEALERDLYYYDLFLFDVMMGRMSGFRLAEKIRSDLKINVPIVFLTARDSENDKLTGFSLGADDYIPKPFSVRELVARVKAVIKRGRNDTPDNPETYIAGELLLNITLKKLQIAGTDTELPRKEFDLLKLFLENRDRIFSREEILNRVWGGGVVVTDRTVDVNIARLRKRMGKYGDLIRSKPGFGYYFVNEQ